MIRERIEDIQDTIDFFLDWFWYYRHVKARYRIYKIGEAYSVSASTPYCGVCNCYASTPEMAMEIAEFRLKQALEQYIDRFGE